MIRPGRHVLVGALLLIVGLVLLAVSSWVLCETPLAMLGQRHVDCGVITFWDARALSRSLAAPLVWAAGLSTLATGVVWLAARRLVRPFVIVTAFAVVGVLWAGVVAQQAPDVVAAAPRSIC